MFRLVSAAIMAAVAGLGVANAQSAGDFGGPRELPPASFSGQQYVDSRGCVFLRAGLSGRVNWVPRVSRDRQPLCGYPPTFGNNQVVIAEPGPERRPVPQVDVPATTALAAPAAAPSRPVQNVVAVPPAAPVKAAPAAVVEQPTIRPALRRSQSPERAPPSATPRKIGCYTDAPVAERFRLQNGGSIVLCTRGDGDIAHARAPRVLAGVAAIAPSGYLEGPDPADRAATRPATGRAAVAAQQGVPKGFRPAFDDDRLNPDRAKGTRAGWAQQDQVWTREVPSRLVADVARGKHTPGGQRRVHASTKSEAAPKPLSPARRFVQVGTFGQPSNAEGASARLAGLGLPVAVSRTARNGKPMQIIFAGPFMSQAEALAALTAAREAGFAEAFIR